MQKSVQAGPSNVEYDNRPLTNVVQQMIPDRKTPQKPNKQSTAKVGFNSHSTENNRVRASSFLQRATYNQNVNTTEDIMAVST